MLQEQVRVLEDEIQGKPNSFIVLPPEPSHEVVERKMEVEDVMQKFTDLQSSNEDASIITVYVSGNPGCGKSQIAREVGKQFFKREAAKGDHDRCTLVMTLNAENEPSMLKSYYQFALKVGVTEYSLNSITGGDSKLLPHDKISHLKALVSAKVQNYSSWLLIFDNVDKLESMRDWQPGEDWGGCGQVLVTTQDSTNLPVADPLCQHVSLSQGMQPDDAKNLLRTICQFSCDGGEEQSVLKALDHQPLAIACAALYACYINSGKPKNPGRIWESYHKKLETLPKRMSTEAVYESTSKSYQSSMTSAVKLALEKVVQNKSFEHVVQFLAMGAPAPVDIDLIVSFVTKQDPGYDEDMIAAKISKCSLLMELCPDDSSRRLIKMHQVVHDVCKDYLHQKYNKEEITAFILSYIETLSTSAQHDPLHFDLEFHMTSQMMAPHLKCLTDVLRCFESGFQELHILDAKNVTTDVRNLQNTFFSFGDICRKHFFLWEALKYFNYALQIAKNDFDGADINKVNFVATTLNNLGVVYHEDGDYKEAKIHHMRALDALRELHPQSSTPEIADSLNKLGNVFFSCGKIQEAKDYFQESLKMREKLYGYEHADVAASLSNLGSVHSEMDDLETAGNFFQRSHALRKNIYGEEHPHVADSLSNLGILCSKACFHKKAIQYHECALEMRKKLFFEDHGLIADSYNNLALAYKFAGQLKQAKECLESALRIREKVSGKEHPAMAALLNNLGVLFIELGELEESKAVLDRALPISLYSGVNFSILHNLELVQCCKEFDSAEKYFVATNQDPELEGFVANDKPGRKFIHYYSYPVAQGEKYCPDPFPLEKYPITPASDSKPYSCSII